MQQLGDLDGIGGGPLAEVVADNPEVEAALVRGIAADATDQDLVAAGSNTTKDAPVFVTAGGVFTATGTGNTAIPATFMDAVTSGAPVRIRVVQQ